MESCPFCPSTDLDAHVVFRGDLVLFVQDERFAPDGYNVGWNCGAIAGESIAHAHLHVLHVMPRFRQEPLAGKGIRALLKSHANAW